MSNVNYSIIYVHFINDDLKYNEHYSLVFTLHHIMEYNVCECHWYDIPCIYCNNIYL